MATYTSHYNLTKPEGTERVNIAIINQNMDAIDAQMYKNAQSIIANHGGMAIPSNNNTHAAVSAGQYVYVYNHSSLAEGVYVATSAISTNGALSLSNLATVPSGGLNHVYNTLNSKIATQQISNMLTPATNVTIKSQHGYLCGSVFHLIANISYSGTHTDNQYTHLATINNSAYCPFQQIVTLQEDNSGESEAWGSSCMMTVSAVGEIKVFKSPRTTLGNEYWVNLIYMV